MQEEGCVKKFQGNRWFPLAINTHRDNQRKILELLRRSKGYRLLDIGCGNGDFTMRCAKIIHAGEAHGIEINEHAAQKAERRGVRVVLGDASQSFPFPDEYFDVIVANQVLEHVLNTDNMLRQCHRVLTRTGVMILSVPNLCSLMGKLLVLLGRQPTCLHVSEIQVGNFLRGAEAGVHIHAFAPAAIKDLLEYHSFKLENTVGVGYYPFQPGKITRLLSRLDGRHSVFLTMKLRKSGI